VTSDGLCTGEWKKPTLADVIPVRVLEEYRTNMDIWLTEEMKAAILADANAKLAALKMKCVPATKAECLAAFDSWLGTDASTTEAAIQTQIDTLRASYQETATRIAEELNDTIIAQRASEYTRCQSLPISTLEERRAKAQCLYDRSVDLLNFLRYRIVGLQQAIQFERLRLVLLVKLTREQISLSLDVPVFTLPVGGTIDALKDFRTLALDRLGDFLRVSLNIAKLKERIADALQKRDRAIALLQDVKTRIEQGIERVVTATIADVKARIEDYRAGVRDIIKTYARNVLDCKTTITAATNNRDASITVSCSVALNAGETKDTIKNRFQAEIRSVLAALLGTPDVVVSTPVDIVDPQLQPQSAKRGILQNNAPLSATGTVTDPNVAPEADAGFALVASFSMLLLTIFATLLF